MHRFFSLVGFFLTTGWLIVVTAAIAPTQSIAGAVEFAGASFQGTENAPLITITLQRSGDVTAAAAVTVRSTDTTATSGEDYVSVTSTVSWAAGDGETKVLELSLIDDSIVEGNEALQLSLSEVSGDVLGTMQTTTVTLIDYEEGQLQFKESAYSIIENATAVEIIVSRVNGSDGELTATFTTVDNSALLDRDYLSGAGNLLFSDAEVQKSIFLVVVNDEIGEADKNFFVELNIGGEVATEPLRIAVTILDDDTDFTPNLQKLSIDSENILYSDTLDMSQVSLKNSEITLLDVINTIPVLNVTGLTARQDSKGTVEIKLGDERFLVRPVAMIRAEEEVKESVLVNPDHSGVFATNEGVNILFQPALSDIDVLQSVLSELGTPELAVNVHGNITVQINQGSPPLEITGNGEVVINNSYYDRYNLRPQFISTASKETETGVRFLSHPVLPAETVLAIIISDPEGNRRQLVGTAPVIAEELFEGLAAVYDVENIAINTPGLVSFDKDGVSHGLFADYIIRNVEGFSLSQVGLTQAADINGDNLPDFKMVYSSGDEQYLFYVPL